MTVQTNRRGHMPFVAILLVVTAALFIAGAMLNSQLNEAPGSSQDSEAAKSELPPVDVRVTKIERRNPDVNARFHGFLAPFVELSVSALVPGQIVEQRVDVSDAVNEGQALYSIDDAARLIDRDKARANLDRYNSDVELAAAHWDRIQGLEKRQSTSIEHKEAEVRWLSAKANKRQAEAAVRHAELLLKRSLVVSPIDGVVSRVHVRSGEFTQIGQPLIDVIDIVRLKLLVELEDREVVWVKVGQPVILVTQTFPAEQFEGKVLRIFPQAKSTNRKFEVEIELMNADGRLRPGFFMTGSIQKPSGVTDDESNGMLIIPREAVVEIFGSKYCYFIRSPGEIEGKADAVLIARRTPVVVFPVASNPRVFQLVQGASEGDLVVTKGLQHLSEETRIHITN